MILFKIGLYLISSIFEFTVKLIQFLSYKRALGFSESSSNLTSLQVAGLMWWWIWKLMKLNYINFESYQLWKLSTLKVINFESYQLWKLSTLKVVNFESCWLWKSSTLKVIDFESHRLWKSSTLKVVDFENHHFGQIWRTFLKSKCFPIPFVGRQ